MGTRQIVFACLILMPIASTITLAILSVEQEEHNNRIIAEYQESLNAMFALTDKYKNTIKELQEALDGANRTMEQDLQTMKECRP